MQSLLISVRPEEHFKDSELGPIPQDWEVMRLGELVSKNLLCLKNGFSQREHNQVGVGVPHLRPFNIGDSGEITLSQVKYIPVPAENAATWVSRGAIVFNNTNSEELVGKTAYFNLDGRFLVSNHMTVIRVCSPQIDAYWLSRYLHWLWRQRVFLRFCRRHVNQASVSLARLKQVPVCLPPLHEQRAIAHVLETVQAAKEATERVVGALRELKKSLMQDLFTYGPVPVGSQHAVPLRDSEIGSIPEHWQMVRLGEVCNLSTKSIDPTESPIMRYVGLEHIEPGNIKITKWGHSKEVKSLKSLFEPGDILYGKLRPYLDKGALAEWSGICSTDILVLRARQHVDATFLAYLLHTQSFVDYAVSTTTGVNHPRTSWQALQKMPVPLPPLSEQREIARILQTVDRRIQAEEAYARALGELFKTLLRELMTGRIRVTSLAAEEDHDPKG
jgi:type I restriction enzyme S subunit